MLRTSRNANTVQKSSPKRRSGRLRIFIPVTRAQFDAVRGKHGALLVGEPEEVAKKILLHSEALGGISRITFQMDVAESSETKLLRAIELLGTKVAPTLRAGA